MIEFSIPLYFAEDNVCGGECKYCFNQAEKINNIYPF